ncbi:hypothetical protein ACLBXJ_15655 [Methylobacterium mesophilicum]
MAKVTIFETVRKEVELDLPAVLHMYGGFETEDRDGRPYSFGGGRMILTDGSMISINVSGWKESWDSPDTIEGFRDMSLKVSYEKAPRIEGWFSPVGKEGTDFSEVLDVLEDIIRRARRDIEAARDRG